MSEFQDWTSLSSREKQLIQICNSDQIPFSLEDIIVAGLCQQKISANISVEILEIIQSVLPVRNEIDLRHSIHEVDDRTEIGHFVKNAINIKRIIPLMTELWESDNGFKDKLQSMIMTQIQILPTIDKTI